MGYSYLTVLMSFPTNSIICAISGLIPIGEFCSLWVFACQKNMDWIDIEILSLLGARYFSIPTNIGELCSGT